MSGVLIVSGTDTGIGKTVVAAGIAAALGAAYWKPIQAGTADGTDSETARALGVAPQKVLAEAHSLKLPASPHLAAQHERLRIEPTELKLPSARPLVVEGAGGLMVPIRSDLPWLMIDQFALWRAPVLLVARTALGTINHSLLSIEALRSRNIPVAGIVFVGDPHADNEDIIPLLGDVPNFGRLPMLDSLDAAALGAAIQARIDLGAIGRAMELAP